MSQLLNLVQGVRRSNSRKENLVQVVDNSIVKLNVNYLNKALENKKINIVIIGQDPYPNGATDIPFFKEDILETLSFEGRNPTGGYVFLDLLHDLTKNILFKDQMDVLENNFKRYSKNNFKNYLIALKGKKTLKANKSLMDTLTLENTSYYQVALSFMEKGVLFLNTRYWLVPGTFKECKASEELNTYILNSIHNKNEKIEIICLGACAYEYINKWFKNTNIAKDKIKITKKEHPASQSSSNKVDATDKEQLTS